VRSRLAMVLRTAIELYINLLPRQLLELIGMPELAPQEQLLASTVGASFWACVGLLFIWRIVIAPGIATYEARTDADKVFLANSFVSLFNAVSAPVLAVLGMRSLPWGDLETNMNAAPDDHAMRAVGLSCGYMLYDTLYCCYYREMRSPLMIAHHVLPVLFWPYCLLNKRMVPMVLFFVLTEVTNIGQHTRILLEKFDLKHSRLYAIVGTSWVVLFFLVRIAPSPYLFFELVNGNYSQYSNVEYAIMFVTTPLPFVLNSYWFYLLVTALSRFFVKKNRLAAQQKADAIAAELLRKHR